MVKLDNMSKDERDLDDLVAQIEDANIAEVGADSQGKKKRNRKKKKTGGELDSAEGGAEAPAAPAPGEANGDADGDEEVPETEGASTAAAKKKKNKKKKKGGRPTQTDPPTVAIKDLFPDGVFPKGEVVDHPIAQDSQTARDRFRIVFALLKQIKRY